jgi:hypothetical protein
MSTTRQTWSNTFYWIGVAMTLVCFALVLAGNTAPLSRFEHRGFPVSWMSAGIAVIAFLLAEFGSSGAGPASEEDLTSRLPAEFEAAEF